MKLADYSSTVANYIRPRVPILIPSVFGITLLVSILSTSYGQNLIHIRYKVEALEMKKIAQTFPEGTPQNVRFSAIAAALWNGHTTYQFVTNVQPPVSNSH